MHTPRLCIIAGCNGAGKTTASMSVLPEVLDCHEFVNADEIAKGLSPLNPEEVAIEAGKLMLQRIDSLLSRNVTFAIETTLASRSYKNLVERAKARDIRWCCCSFGFHRLKWRRCALPDVLKAAVTISRMMSFTGAIGSGLKISSIYLSRSLTFGRFTTIQMNLCRLRNVIS